MSGFAEGYRAPRNPEAEEAAASILEDVAAGLESIQDPVIKAQTASVVREQFPEFIRPIIEDAQADIVSSDEFYRAQAS